MSNPEPREPVRAGSGDAARRAAILRWLRGVPASEAAGTDAATLDRWTDEYCRSKLPYHPGAVEEVAGTVHSRVRIRRDRWGVAHITAETVPDLFFGLGYAMAQDRLWQLDYQRRLVRGALAEIFGPSALESDRRMRTLGIARAGDRAWESAPPSVRTVVEALTAGINRWMEVMDKRLPIEFEILEYEPRPWHPSDSCVVWKHRWWTLTGRLEQIVVGEVARRLPPDLSAAFFSVELSDETIVWSDETPGFHGPVPAGSSDEGSNNWVVGGMRTTTGAPVLCSDPHNPFSAPSQWFEVQLTCPEFDAAGAVYIGTPVLYLGRNRHVAWGLTNHAAATCDLYYEEVAPDHPDQYRDRDAWRPFEVEHQRIPVKGEPDAQLEIRRTVRGPIVNELLPRVEGLLEAPISLRWVGAEVSAGFEASLALIRARSAAEVIEALRQWPGPPLNFVYADRSGTIGYHAAGLIPRRGRAGPGMRSANDPDDVWRGFVEFDDLPHVENPARGWVGTANNVPWTRNPAYLADGAWSDGYRMRRIRERLSAAEKWRPEEIAAIQADVVSVRARDLVPALLSVVAPGETPTEREAVAVLRTWDARFTVDSVGASIWTAFWVEWRLALARARFPETLAEYAADQIGAVARRLLLGEPLAWMPVDLVVPTLREAFRRAVAALEQWGGPDVQAWRWGRLHQVTYHHPIARNPVLAARYDVGPFETGGGSGIVRAAGHGMRVPFAVASGSTYRFMADLSKPDAMISVQTLGQSAQPASPHYCDQTQLWLADQYHPLWMADEEVEANREAELIIQPVSL
ncbi:MAG: penicillin acylase family protein [Chloroflexi bacterium]|nr:penicillin acylase family protein [Chloroflexota bacterium]